MRKIKVKNPKREKFYTPQEMQVIREKMSGIKVPNNYRNEKISDLIEEFGEERTKKLIEEEVYLFKNSMVLVWDEATYKAMNGKESDMVDYTFKNRNEIMRNSMYEFLGIGIRVFS